MTLTTLALRLLGRLRLRRAPLRALLAVAVLGALPLPASLAPAAADTASAPASATPAAPAASTAPAAAAAPASKPAAPPAPASAVVPKAASAATSASAAVAAASAAKPAAASVSVAASPSASAAGSAAAPSAALPASAPAPAAKPSAASAGGARRMSWPLEFVPADLPPARVGTPYGPLPLVRYLEGNAVLQVQGDLPGTGLEVGADAQLRGLPLRPGRLHFTLTLDAAPGVSAPLRQSFTLRVLGPRRAAVPAEPVSAPAPAPLTVPRERIDQALVPAEVPQAWSWKLSAWQVEQLAQELALPAPGKAAAPAAAGSAAEGDEAAEAVAPAPDPDLLKRAQARLGKVTAGVLDVEYPTRELMARALDAAADALCETLVQPYVAASAVQPVRAGPKAPSAPPSAALLCNPRLDADARGDGEPAAAPDPAAGLTARQLRAELLPGAQRDRLVALAQRVHLVADAAPVRWSGGGCGCVAPQIQGVNGNVTYGMVPFWQPVAGLPPLQLDFSAYVRLGYMGVVLGEGGSLAPAPGWNDTARDGLREALRHGTRLDLVLYGRSPALLPLQEAARRKLADDLVAMVQAPLGGTGASVLRALLSPWPEPAHLYSGVTLFFTEMPDDAQARESLRQLARELAQRLKAGGRRLALNVVLPAAAVKDFVGLLDGDEQHPPLARSDAELQVRLLVLLGEPASTAKKALRIQLDRSGLVTGARLTSVLERLVPLLFYPGAADPPPEAAAEAAPAASAASAPPPPPPKAVPMPEAQADQFGDDLAYLDWNYGGAALWPLPAAGYGMAADAQRLLLQAFRDSKSWWDDGSEWRWDGLTPMQQLCTWTCPRRTLLRGVLNLLVAGVALAMGAYYLNWRLYAMGWRYKRWPLAGGVAAGALFLQMLNCDPDLYTLSQGNALLGVLLALAGLWVLGLLLRKQEPLP